MANAVKDLQVEKIEIIDVLDETTGKKGINKWMLVSGITASILSIAGGTAYFVFRKRTSVK